MTTDNRGKRNVYQKQLKERAKTFLQAEAWNQVNDREEEAELLYIFVKAEALASYKNGVAVGEKRKRRTRTASN